MSRDAVYVLAVYLWFFVWAAWLLFAIPWWEPIMWRRHLRRRAASGNSAQSEEG